MSKNPPVPHDPKPIRYQMNVRQEHGLPKYYWDSNTPFPAIVAGQELLIEGEGYMVNRVTHDFSWTDVEIRCITTAIID